MCQTLAESGFIDKEIFNAVENILTVLKSPTKLQNL